MFITGLQKMTLLDYPGKVAATVFLSGCDFRCPFCHNFELVENAPSPVISEDEFLSFLQKRRGMLDGIVVTGGEPCLRKDLGDFIKKIKDLGYLVKLDTNGNNPARLKEIVNAGFVDYVAMDVKNSLPKYGKTIGISNFDTSNIEESIRFLLEGNVDYEFRTTIVGEYHDESDFVLIGRLIKGAKAYYLQQYTERDTVPDKSLTSPKKDDMENFLRIVREYVPNAQLRGI